MTSLKAIKIPSFLLDKSREGGWVLDIKNIQRNKAQKLKTKNEKLKEFVQYIIKTECWGIYDHDGYNLQEKAEELGLIYPCIATKEDVDPEFDDFEVGDTIYKFTDILKGGE